MVTLKMIDLEKKEGSEREKEKERPILICCSTNYAFIICFLYVP